MKNTMIELVTELEKLPKTPYIETLISKAKEGQFHDYRSKALCGKMYAVQCIDHVQMHDSQLTPKDSEALQIIRQDIIEGEYDEPFTKEDQEIVFKEIDEDPSVSERDRDFFKSMMKTPEDKKNNRAGFGKRYF